MFCCQMGKRYALTCLHVCYNKNDKEINGQEFFEFLKENQSNPKQVELHLKSNKYLYETTENQETELGHFNNFTLENNADIIAIKVDKNVSVNFKQEERKNVLGRK